MHTEPKTEVYEFLYFLCNAYRFMYLTQVFSFYVDYFIVVMHCSPLLCVCCELVQNNVLQMRERENENENFNVQKPTGSQFSVGLLGIH